MIKHDYECGKCGETHEYKHAINENPSKCFACGEIGYLTRCFSMPMVAPHGKAGSFVHTGLFLHPRDGIARVGTTREIRNDNLPGLIQANLVDLDTGENLGNHIAEEYRIRF